MNRPILLVCFVLLKAGHVIILQRTVSFKFRLYIHVYMYKFINLLGKFPRDLHIQAKEVYSRLFFQSSSQLPYCFLTGAVVIVAFVVFKAPLYPVHTNSENFKNAYIYMHIFLHRLMWTGL